MGLLTSTPSERLTAAEHALAALASQNAAWQHAEMDRPGSTVSGAPAPHLADAIDQASREVERSKVAVFTEQRLAFLAEAGARIARMARLYSQLAADMEGLRDLERRLHQDASRAHVFTLPTLTDEAITPIAYRTWHERVSSILSSAPVPR